MRMQNNLSTLRYVQLKSGTNITSGATKDQEKIRQPRIQLQKAATSTWSPSPATFPAMAIAMPLGFRIQRGFAAGAARTLEAAKQVECLGGRQGAVFVQEKLGDTKVS